MDFNEPWLIWKLQYLLPPRGRRYESLVGRTFVLNHSPWGTRLLEVKATGEKLFHVVFIAQHHYRWLLSSP